jgi:hypothetical protein
LSVLPDPQPTSQIPEIPPGSKPDYVIDGSKIPEGMLDHLLAGEMCRLGLDNMQDVLLKFLLMRLLSSDASQKLKAGPALSSMLNQLKWQQLGAKLRPQLILDGSNFPCQHCIVSHVQPKVL